MRLVAIYIYENSLPHIFGQNHAEITLNFGGKFIYDCTIDKEGHFTIKKEDNKNYIKNFFGKNIELVSAIVGANGTGKTTILDLIKSDNNSHIYEDKIDNQTLIIYYTPFIRSDDINDFVNVRNISKFRMMELDTPYDRMSISDVFHYHNSEKIKRIIKYVSKEETKTILKDTFLPVFDKITITIKSLKTDHYETPNKFRPFFDKFEEIETIERGRLTSNIIKEHNLSSDDLRKRNPSLDVVTLKSKLILKVIYKVHNILESSGNKYLKEGFLYDDISVRSKKFSNILSLKEAFYFFIENAYIQQTNKSDIIKLPVKEIKELVELLLSNVNKISINDWGSFDVSFLSALAIIESYEKFLLAFKRDFTYDTKALFNFKPNKRLSTGEDALYELFTSLDDLKNNIRNKIDTDYSDDIEPIYSTYLILLDEADLGFHPSWKKRYINTLLKVVSKTFQDKNIQIIFTTHDPLSLSDIPNDKIVYLSKSKNETIIETGKKSFGANINDLLSDAFYVKDSLMGDFAKEKIEETIKWINKNKEHPRDISEDKLNYYKQIISIIDEPIISIKLAEMLEELLEGNPKLFQEQMIQKEINYLIDKKDNL